MSRTLNRLTSREVASLKRSGRHSDGGGLYLRITKQGAKGWTFMHSSDGKRREISLGAVHSTTLLDARRLAGEMRQLIQSGCDPRAALPSLEATVAPLSPTFGDFAEAYIASVEQGWRNEVHRQQWRHSLRDHAKNLEMLPIDQIDTNDVLSALQPIWTEKPETAKRVRGRIERILDAAKARGIRERDTMNPAMWRGHLQLLLPAQSKLTRGHHKAMAWADIPGFMTGLQERQALAARCLEFTIFTAARSGEALGATWQEIDLQKGLWSIPAARMKAGAPHTVPLATAALALLERLAADGGCKPTQFVFSVRGAKRSNMAMSMLLRRMEKSDVTVHGFRSTFRDWAGDATDYPRELIEQALAHTIQNKAERAYRRGAAIERRRVLMEDWAGYLLGHGTTNAYGKRRR
ncbi:integrase arm-type DNA-binding domain-containing protein [Sphingomonas sp. S1-29]|uniref:tyrosine-type recombinase/integrase n=1 Tax=Sphingomonas sp. S1-29 TaxID=2991074 RepID=UPI00223FADBF|nr:integrase arm-type DNA-binding domain-containing protein [Sphingomonas sp. S1-29]UZK70486.1 integrase arm-type DNA-binding domain-containing protein [Sphingomonas sp. S1-29]